MTVRDLKELLSVFPENAQVVVCSSLLPNHTWYIPVKNISAGVNEFDGLVFIDDYEEED